MKVKNLLTVLIDSISEQDINLDDEILLCCKTPEHVYDKYSEVITVVGYGDGTCSILGTLPKEYDELFVS